MWPEWLASSLSVAVMSLRLSGYVFDTTQLLYSIADKLQTWANEINNGSAEERALTISSMNGLFYATSESITTI